MMSSEVEALLAALPWAVYRRLLLEVCPSLLSGNRDPICRNCSLELSTASSPNACFGRVTLSFVSPARLRFSVDTSTSGTEVLVALARQLVDLEAWFIALVNFSQ